MCHMVADSESELHAMAEEIGVDRRHYQYPHKSNFPHYDICLQKRALALSYGALEINMRQAPSIARSKHERGLYKDNTQAGTINEQECKDAEQ